MEEAQKIWKVNTLLSIIDQTILCDIIDKADMTQTLLSEQQSCVGVDDRIAKLQDELSALNAACNKESGEKKEEKEYEIQVLEN